MWSRKIVRESLHIYLSFVAGTLCGIRATARGHTWHVCLSDPQVSPFAWETNKHLAFAWATSGFLSFAWATSGSLPFAWATSRSLPFTWVTSRSAFSPKLQTLYCLFKSHAEVQTSSSLHILAGYWNLHTSIFFFPVICWSYLWTEISVILSTGNKLYSRHHLLFFSFLWNHFVDVILRLHWIR